MSKKLDIIITKNEDRAESFIGKVLGKKPLFICTIGTSDTAKIPGISAAGMNPELTYYTPPADVELLLLGRCKCIDGVPITPDGIPTPALITMSALKLAKIPALIVSGGLKIKPHVPFLDLGGSHGGDIRNPVAVENVEEVIQRAIIAGETLAELADYLVIGESMPGGTTTALGVLLAMGIDAAEKVSSSMPGNPHALKKDTVMTGLEASGEKIGSLADDPIRAISILGDPMMPAFAGLVTGAAEKIPVMMAGGTQMGAVLTIVKALNKRVLDNIAIGTTKWIISDNTSDLKGIIDQIGNVPIMAADLDFSHSSIEGLQVYEKGIVKEGVGAGGAAISAMIRTRGEITKKTLLGEIERYYRALLGQSD
jgi:uncharacterized protein (TIGR00303 family)